jgi:MFS family permease
MPRRSIALAVLCAAEILVALDGMLVSVALPSIQRDLGFSDAALQWVITAYTLTLGGFLLLGGRVADRLGRRRTLLAGLSLFTVASLAAALARGQAELLAARALAGFGAALAIPAALALITALFNEGRERNRALGIVSAGIDVGLVAGAVLGGLVTAALGWPWVFVAVVPFGAAAIAAIPRAIEADAGRRAPTDGRGAERRVRSPAAPRRRALLTELDAAGAALAAAGLALLVAGLTRAEVAGVGAASTLGAFVLAAALLGAFVLR